MTATTKEEMLKTLLNDRVRPILMAHGGDVEFVSVSEDNRLTVRLLGSCSSCPISRMTLEETVTTTVREAWPELKSIELASPIGDDMLAKAREILSGQH